MVTVAVQARGCLMTGRQLGCPAKGLETCKLDKTTVQRAIDDV